MRWDWLALWLTPMIIAFVAAWWLTRPRKHKRKDRAYSARIETPGGWPYREYRRRK